MCECRNQIEAQLLERFKTSTPDASDHHVSLQGYGFARVGNTLSMRPFMSYTYSADHPLKKGGSKHKTQKGSMMFSFCPFCGEKASKGAAK